jgi:HD-GYP domain-containing protein (c-di-GMP phosphodiesterase class II)
VADRPIALTLPKSSKVFILSLLGLAILVLWLLTSQMGSIDWQAFIFWGILLALPEFFPSQFPSGIWLSVSFAAEYSSIIVLGPGAAVWLVAFRELVVGLVLQLWIRRGYRKRNSVFPIVFNFSQFVIAIGAAGFVYQMVMHGGGADSYPRVIIPLCACAVTYFVLNTGLMAGAVWFHQRIPFFYQAWTIGRSVALGHVVLAIAGGATAWLYLEVSPWVVALAIPFLLLIRVHFQDKVEVRKSEEESMAMMAKLIEAKDRYTEKHSQRVIEYSDMILREMRVSWRLAETVKRAALVHDIGKIGTKDATLTKPGWLTAEEYEAVKAHPGQGAEILAKKASFGREIPIVRHHHESINGSGYPDGLAGEEIPVGARILAVADAYDAMTSPRPYKPARSREEAVTELRRCSGTQFDTDAVEALVRALEKQGGPIIATTALRARVRAGLETWGISVPRCFGAYKTMVVCGGCEFAEGCLQETLADQQPGVPEEEEDRQEADVGTRVLH